MTRLVLLAKIWTSLSSEKDSFAASRNAALEAKVLAQLNSKGITNRSGGHFGQSLHVPKCGYHEVGDVEFVIDDIKVHAHADVLSEHSTI